MGRKRYLGKQLPRDPAARDNRRKHKENSEAPGYPSVASLRELTHPFHHCMKKHVHKLRVARTPVSAMRRKRTLAIQRQEWLASGARTSPLRSNGEGDRSAARLSGGGASRDFSQTHQPFGNGARVGEDVGGGDPHNGQAER